MKTIYLFVATILVSLFALSNNASAVELVVGEERVEPGVVFVFEGAVKDHVVPTSLNLAENKTDVHIEARVNWDEKNIPDGTPAGGFVPYLHITAQVINESTKQSTFIDLLPHVNLIDNFHYARNMTLPGDLDQRYTVKFTIQKPTHIELALHRDWINQYGESLLDNQVFQYSNIDFEEVAKASRG